MRRLKSLPVVWPPLTGDVHQTWPGKRWFQKPGPWCRFKDRLGRRGAMLLTLGITYTLIGYGDATRPPPDVLGAWHLHAIDPYVRGAAWIVTGILAILFALTRPDRDAERIRWWQEDAIGWVSLYFMPLLYIASFMTSYVTWIVTDHSRIPASGDPMAWYNAAIRIPFVVTVLVCSGWLENPRKCR